MNQITRIDELTGQHIGRRVRLQNPMGGYIEGTLAKVYNRVTTPFGSQVETFVELDEFVTKIRQERVQFWVNGVDIAKVIDE